MARYSSDSIITAIDIGTTKICVLIGHKLDGATIEIIGSGTAPSHGLKKGVVVDIAKTVHSIKIALQQAEIMADVIVETASVGVSGSHISSQQSHGMIPLKKNKVTQQDINDVMNAAQAIAYTQGQHVLHALPQYFIIDGKEKVLHPLNMHGVRLEVQAHIILGSVSCVQNLINCCETAGVRVTDVILEQLASADAVLSDDERELGCGLLDIGGGTSDFALYKEGSIRHSMVLPIAGNHFTSDIAIGLSTTLHDAERIKRTYGNANKNTNDKTVFFEVEMIEGYKKRTASLSDLIAIIEPRAYELLKIVSTDTTLQHLKHYMSSGLVLTGGGSLLPGLDKTAQLLFDVPIRIGQPHITFDLPESLRSPIYATGYGLLIYTLKKQSGSYFINEQTPLSERIVTRMKSWIADFF